MTLSQKEEQKRISSAQLRVLFDNTNDHGICMLNANGRILSWNDSSKRLTGYSVSEAIGKNYSILFPKDEVRRRVPQRVLSTVSKKGRVVMDGLRIRKDGSHFWARSFMTLVRAHARAPAHYVLITHDISESRVTEQKREEYIGIASHELRTPITTLSLYSEILAKRMQLDKDKKNLRMLRDMQGQTARLVSLVDDLLVVNNIESGTLRLHKEDFHPGKLIRKIAKDYNLGLSSHRVSCRGTFARTVYADKGRIAQVVANLIANAIKYSPHSNKILIHIGRKKNTCVVSVQDFGQGVSKKDQKNVFKRFYRLDNAEIGNIAGSGLGLYISREIVRKHRQRIWLDSVEGKGATFSFTLPLS